MSKSLLAAIAAIALTTTTTTAATAASNPAAGLSLAGPRAATPVAQDSRLGTDVAAATYVSIGVLVALVVIVVVATSGDSDSN